MSDTKAGQDRVSIEKILLLDAGAGKWFSDRRMRYGAVTAAVAALVLLYWLFSGPRSTVRYTTQPVTRGPLVVVVTATGSVQPTNKVEVSSELSGTIRKVNVDFNSLVKAGDALAELDMDKLKATAASSRAHVASAKAKVADAKATMLEKQQEVMRKRLLAGKQISTVHDLEAAEAAYDRAVAAVASAEAEVGVTEADLALNELNLVKAVIRSPISGVVLTRNVDPGQTVASNFQAPVLFSIAEDLSKMELQVDVDEADVGRVKKAQGATFGVDAFADRKFPATIRDVRYAPETIQGVVTYKAMLTIDNSELLLRPGMTATAEIRVADVADALLVSNAALRYTPTSDATSQDKRTFLQRILPGPPFRATSLQQRSAKPDERTVWTLEGGKPVAIAVTVGATDGRRTEIKAGQLKPGTPLITDQGAAKP